MGSGSVSRSTSRRSIDVYGHPSDRVLEEWVELNERLTSAKSTTLTTHRGLVRWKTCKNPKCSGRLGRDCRERCHPNTGELSYHCSRCGHQWMTTIGFVLRSQLSAQRSRKPGTSDEHLARLASLRMALESLELDERRIYLELFCYEEIGGYAEIARVANERWPRSRPPDRGRGPRPSGWTEWTVRRTINDCRAKIRSRL